MLNLSIKLSASIVILSIAIIFGLFPILIKATIRTKRILIHGEYFSDGVFLGAGLIHLLPDAQMGFDKIYSSEFPIILTICAFSVFFLRAIEEGSTKLYGKFNNYVWLAYLLTLLLSVHSVLAGIALGIESTLSTFLIIYMFN